MSTLTTRDSIFGAGPFLSIQAKRTRVPVAGSPPAWPKKGPIGVKGRSHKLTLALCASVKVRLQGVDDFGEIFGSVHGAKVGFRAWRSRDKPLPKSVTTIANPPEK